MTRVKIGFWHHKLVKFNDKRLTNSGSVATINQSR